MAFTRMIEKERNKLYVSEGGEWVLVRHDETTEWVFMTVGGRVIDQSPYRNHLAEIHDLTYVKLED